MVKYIITGLFSVLFFMNARCQVYIDALGLKLGPSIGITYRHYFDEKLAVEAILMSRWHGIASDGLLEWHQSFKDAKGLQWYLGPGIQVGYWSYNKDFHWLPPGKSSFIAGATGIAGIEYDFKDVPLEIGIDWKPVFNFLGLTKPWLDEFSLSLKFRLN